MKYLLLAFLLFTTLTSVTDNITNRFSAPPGYVRQKNDAGSFGEWLQNLPLKPAGTHTKTYRGDIAATDIYTAAVADVTVGNQNLQQCADAVMRLRAEYLYHKKAYNEISFNFVSGFKCDYEHYSNGYRYLRGKWVLTSKKDYIYSAFLRYMNLVFSYASTLSLEKELKPVIDMGGVRSGDVFIRGGSPGYCFMVMDVVEDKNHNQQFLLAQSFMPAQNIQILKSDGSQWFSLNRQANIYYAELISTRFLRRFE